LLVKREIGILEGGEKDGEGGWWNLAFQRNRVTLILAHSLGLGNETGNVLFAETSQRHTSPSNKLGRALAAIADAFVASV
jgi:hypothetical protein